MRPISDTYPDDVVEYNDILMCTDNSDIVATSTSTCDRSSVLELNCFILFKNPLREIISEFSN